MVPPTCPLGPVDACSSSLQESLKGSPEAVNAASKDMVAMQEERHWIIS
jgi:hypothetical protein